MIRTLFDNHVFIYILLALTGFGILMKLVVQVLYTKLLRASESMSTSTNKLAKNMKKKFEAYYKLKLGVNNVDIFVDKHFFHYKFCGIFLSTWESLCGQVLVLSLLVGAISTILGLIYDCGKDQILSTFTVGILSCGLLIFLEGIVNPAGKKEMIRLNMKDYLENILKVRLVQEENQPELMEQYKKAYQPSSFMAVSKEQPEKDTLKPFRVKKKNKSKEAKRLEKLSQKARKQDEAAKKKENKKLSKINKRTEAKEQRNTKKEAKLNGKKERELSARKQKEGRKQEAARLKAEVLEKEQQRKEEKQQQKEIKKVLKLEKKHRSHTVKTTAQEKKENLLKEIQGRRSVEPQETDDNETEVYAGKGELSHFPDSSTDRREAVESRAENIAENRAENKEGSKAESEAENRAVSKTENGAENRAVSKADNGAENRAVSKADNGAENKAVSKTENRFEGKAVNYEGNHPNKDRTAALAAKTSDLNLAEEAKPGKTEETQEKKIAGVTKIETRTAEIKPAEVRTAKVRDIKPRQLMPAPDITYRDDRTAAALEDGKSYRTKEYEMIKPISEEDEKIIDEILKDIFA